MISGTVKYSESRQRKGRYSINPAVIDFNVKIKAFKVFKIKIFKIKVFFW
jgi:hypothetical protein